MQLPVQICRDKQRNTARSNSHFFRTALSSTNKQLMSRSSPRTNAGKKPDYYSREEMSGKKGSKRSTELKGVHEGKKFRPIGKKRTSSKTMMAKKKRKATDDEESEEDSDYDSEDEEDNDDIKITPQKKKGRMKYSDKESSVDDVPVATVVKNRNDDNKTSKTTQELKKIIAERESTIEELQSELARYRKAGSRMNNAQVREELHWSAEEINFAETVNNFCKHYLFVRIKFLKDDWQSYLPMDKSSLYSVCMRKLSIPENADRRDIWERVIVPAISRKYKNLKCNLANDIKTIYMSMRSICVDEYNIDYCYVLTFVLIVIYSIKLCSRQHGSVSRCIGCRLCGVQNVKAGAHRLRISLYLRQANHAR